MPKVNCSDPRCIHYVMPGLMSDKDGLGFCHKKGYELHKLDRNCAQKETAPIEIPEFQSIGLKVPVEHILNFTGWDYGKTIGIPTDIRVLLRLKKRIMFWLHKHLGLPIGLKCYWCGSIWNIEEDGELVDIETIDGFHDLIPVCPKCINGDESDIIVNYIYESADLGVFDI